MFGRSPILVAAAVIAAIVMAAAHAQSVPDPADKAAGTGALQDIDSDRAITPPPTLPDVPPLLPGRPSPGLPRYPTVSPAPGQFAPAPNPGPVTGYGPGGMAPMPGAPANPPYSSGPFR